MAYLYRISGLSAPLDFSQDWLEAEVKQRLGVRHLQRVRISKESVDARKRRKLSYVLQVEVSTDQPIESLPKNVQILERSAFDIPDPPALHTQTRAPHDPVVVVGAGPAGYFAALTLVEAGVKTILLERGKAVDVRMRDIGQLRSHGTLDPESNVCFGEGGAGAYTDGKLYTRIKHPYVRWVMKRLVDFGSPEDILIKAHPHLGTDKLVRIVKRMREHLVERGVDVRFGAKVERLRLKDGQVQGVVLADGSTIATSRVVLGIGHSARDTLANLLEDGVSMEAKSFAVGVRVEHPQALVDQVQYGDSKHKARLGAAAYSLTHQVADADLERRGIYSFCMCPGGFIVPSPTELEHMAINGMSNANRSTAFANSGIVVQIVPEDLLRRGFEDSPLMCIAFQRQLEEATFAATKQPYGAPAMRISDFVAGKASGTLAPTHFRPVAEPADLRELLPPWIADPLREGLEAFNRKLKGFTSSEANMLAVESRTSSPIRMTRGDDLQSVSTKGLYPVGEGAGYAGGIVSAAVDGVKAAESIANALA